MSETQVEYLYSMSRATSHKTEAEQKTLCLTFKKVFF